jgi:hypothetical protein
MIYTRYRKREEMIREGVPMQKNDAVASSGDNRCDHATLFGAAFLAEAVQTVAHQLGNR